MAHLPIGKKFCEILIKFKKKYLQIETVYKIHWQKNKFLTFQFQLEIFRYTLGGIPVYQINLKKLINLCMININALE